MSVRLLFLVCLGLVSNAYSQVLGNGIGFNNGFGPNGFGSNGFGSNGLGPNHGPGLGGCGYPGAPVGYGDVAIVGELPVGGNTAIAGQVPVIGYVNFEGYLPAGGLVSVAPNNCGCV